MMEGDRGKDIRNGCGCMKCILVVNGPNLDMLGIREPDVYGRETLVDLERLCKEHGKKRDAVVSCYQANGEGDLIRAIHAARDGYDGIVYNPGAHTHYSYALRDAVASIDVPVVEVHLSAIDEREPFRRVSVIAPACVAQVKGCGPQGYCDAIDILLEGRADGRLGEGYELLYPEGRVIISGQDVSAAASISDKRIIATCEESGFAEEIFLAQPGAATRRLVRLRRACAEEGIHAFLVRDTANIRWVSAFDGVFDDEDAHALLVTPHDAVLHTDSRYAEAARAAAAVEAVIEVDAVRKTHASFAVNALVTPHDEPVTEEEPSVVLGIEDDMTLADYRMLETALADDPVRPRLEETSGFIRRLRAVKEESEIARMKAAQAITDAAFSHIVAFMRPGMTERQVQIELEDFMVRHGAEGLAFGSIVATGANGASPHAIPGETRLEAGHCVVLDFGARAYGYCSDMTRTVFLGQPDTKIRDAYGAIRRANEEVEELLKPGVTGAQAHEHAERVLADSGFAGAMGHGLGHGVGIDIHEEPVLSPRNARPLVSGNVVTVEPGIYLPGEFGMRLEDCGVITHDGFEVFTQSSHDMVII